jgi:LysM repeat protein/predicted nucleic acid-binding Zn ribbon protein
MTYRDFVDAPLPAVPQGPTCPHCGTRLADQASVCFMCGAVMQTARRRRRQIPWLDLALLVLIVGAIAFWWTRSAPPPAAGVTSLGAPMPAGGNQLLNAATMTATATPSPNWTVALATLTLTPTPTPMPAYLNYSVVAGDTLLGIAAKFGVPVDSILAANKLKASDRLGVKQALLIPTAGMNPEALALGGTPAPTVTADTSTLMYRVKSGDTLLGIAGQFKSTINAILDANQLKPDAILHIGQVLIIPRGTPTPTFTPTAAASPTPTPGPPFAAPILLGPAADAVLAAAEPVVLRWSAVGTLGEEDWYVVHVWSLAPGGPSQEHHVKGTSLRLDPALRPADYVTERSWRWQVVVARHAGHVDAPEPRLTPEIGQPVTPTPLPALGSLRFLSDPSEVRAFTWK